MTSRWPSVVRRPTLAPLRSRSALVATVVPWMIDSVRARSPATSSPRSAARRPRPSISPSDGSRGVEADFAMTTRPRASTAARSVKVPPTSIPIRYTALTCRGGREAGLHRRWPETGAYRSFRQDVGAGIGLDVEGVERAGDQRVVAQRRGQLDEPRRAEPPAQRGEGGLVHAVRVEKLGHVRDDLGLVGQEARGGAAVAERGDRLAAHAGLLRERHV